MSDYTDALIDAAMSQAGDMMIGEWENERGSYTINGRTFDWDEPDPTEPAMRAEIVGVGALRPGDRILWDGEIVCVVEAVPSAMLITNERLGVEPVGVIVGTSDTLVARLT